MQQVGEAKSLATRKAASRSTRSLKVGSGPDALLRVGEGTAAMGRLAVERGDLVRVLPVWQVALLAKDERQLLGEARRRRCG